MWCRLFVVGLRLNRHTHTENLRRNFFSPTEKQRERENGRSDRTRDCSATDGDRALFIRGFSLVGVSIKRETWPPLGQLGNGAHRVSLKEKGTSQWELPFNPFGLIDSLDDDDDDDSIEKLEWAGRKSFYGDRFASQKFSINRRLNIIPREVINAPIYLNYDLSTHWMLFSC